MNKALLSSLVLNPYSISDADVEALEQLVENFPYCQIARVLIAKAAYDKGSMFSEKKTKTAAAYTASRKTLKHLLISKASTVNFTTETEALPIDNVSKVTIVNQELPAEESESDNLGLDVKPIVIEQVTEIITGEKTSNQLPSLNDEISKSLEELSKKKDLALQSIKENLQKETERIQPKDSTDEVVDNVVVEDAIAPVDIAPVKEIQQEVSLDKAIEKEEIASTPTPEPVETKAELPTEPASKIEENSISDITKEETKTEEIAEPKPKNKRTDKRVLPPDAKQDLTHTNIHLSESRLGDEISKDLGDDVGTDLLLHYLEYRKNRSKEIKEVVKPTAKVKDDSLSIIEDFIKKEPSITKVNKKVPTNTQDLSVDSIKENEKLYTENLAKINIMQGNFDKAIRIYEVLIMKYPQKKSYFAEQIENLNNR